MLGGLGALQYRESDFAAMNALHPFCYGMAGDDA
jgi:hypothetical protein